MIRRTVADAGNGFLLHQGFTLVWSAWAADVAATPGDRRLLLAAPIATDSGRTITGKVAYELIVEAPARASRASPECSAPPMRRRGEGAPDAELAERERPDGARAEIPRTAWSFVEPPARRTATEMGSTAGFKPGRIYQLTYPARDPIVRGARNGRHSRPHFLLAPGIRSGACRRREKSAIFGISQSGRLIQTMLLRGPACRRGRQASLRWCIHSCRRRRQGRLRLSVRHADRHASVLEDHIYPTDYFPFATNDRARSGERRRKARCSTARARAGPVPKLFYVNNSSEYWNRAASLIATDPGRPARSARGARGAHLPHRRCAALRRGVAPARHVRELRRIRWTIIAPCAR